MFKQGYSLKEVSIIPASYSRVVHRAECDPFTVICGRGMLPIFVAPMAAVTNGSNYGIWLENKVTPVIPRTLDYWDRLKLACYTFASISLIEAESFVQSYKFNMIEPKKYLCIDIANGNMERLFNVAKQIKSTFGDNVELMTGNIASPEAYIHCCLAGIDWVRVGIGGGSRCTTSCATGIHYPMATLLDEIRVAKKSVGDFKTKVIADGGINWYDDINKALVLGADAVMMGKMFAECEEACGETFEENGILYRDYAGMSHRSMQKATGGNGDKVSEGIVSPVEVKYPVGHLLENIKAYLRSCMSYTNSMNLEQLRRASVIISNNFVYKK